MKVPVVDGGKSWNLADTVGSSFTTRRSITV